MIDLYPHQKKGSRYITERGGGYLFWKPRVGKSYPAIEAMIKHGKGPILIITKSSILKTWEKALCYDYGIPEDRLGVLTRKVSKEARLKLIKEKKIIIINYQSVISLVAMTARPWGVIIFDESLAIGNYTARVTRYILQRIRHQPQGQLRISLTGTPNPESPLQFVTQFLAVDGNFMGYGNYDSYLREHWEKVDHSWKPKKSLHIQMMREYVEDNAEFLSLEELGLGSTKLYDHRIVELNQKQLDCFSWAKGKKMEMLFKYVGMNQKSLAHMVYGMYENMIAAGIDPVTKEVINTTKVEDIIDCYNDNPEPILVLSHFVDMLPVACDLFNNASIRCAYIRGDTGDIEAEGYRVAFQNGELDCLLGQSKKMAEGLDCSKANLTYVISNSFSANTREQMCERTINLQKTTPVGIIDICSRDTTDLKVVETLNKKQNISSNFIKEHSRLI